MKYISLILCLLFSPAWSAALIYDPEQNKILHQQGEDQVRPIASITKLMTAMVVLESKNDLSVMVTLDSRVGTALPQGQYTKLELMHAMLVHSDNAAAETLAQNHPGGRFQFVKDMNLRATKMGLQNTKFIDPSGLSVFNVSTMQELAVLVYTSSEYELIRSISTLPWVSLTKKTLPNTSSGLLSKFQNVVITKTGFTNHAGFCAGMVIVNRGKELVVIVLGEPSKHRRLLAVDQLTKTI